MLFFSQPNLVLFSNPKTGTTALHHRLERKADVVLRGRPGIKHIRLHGYKQFIEPLLRQGDVTPNLCSVIRNPLDWIGSWYRYRSRNALAGQPNSTRGISYDDFVLETIKDKPANFAKFIRQQSCVLDKNGKRCVKYLFTYENQAGFAAFLEDKLKMRLNLKPKNVSPSMPLALSDEVRQQFEQKWKGDFKVWQMAIDDQATA